MKKVFIDGGARTGESLSLFLNHREEFKGGEVYLFECNPTHHDTLNKLKEETEDYSIHVRPEALWNEEGECDFYISVDVWEDLGCTLKPEKREQLDLENPLKVNTISLSKFLKQFQKDDYIVVKLDIEGAEAEVVQDLLDTGMVNSINELYVEWHDHFFSTDFETLRRELNNLTHITYGEWQY